MDAKAIQYTMGKSRKRETEDRESEKPKERRAQVNEGLSQKGGRGYKPLPRFKGCVNC